MLRRAVDVFGFHLAGLDLRQNSDIHALAIGELFEQAGVELSYADLPSRIGRRSCAESSRAQGRWPRRS